MPRRKIQKNTPSHCLQDSTLSNVTLSINDKYMIRCEQEGEENNNNSRRSQSIAHVFKNPIEWTRKVMHEEEIYNRSGVFSFCTLPLLVHQWYKEGMKVNQANNVGNVTDSIINRYCARVISAELCYDRRIYNSAKRRISKLIDKVKELDNEFDRDGPIDRNLLNGDPLTCYIYTSILIQRYRIYTTNKNHDQFNGRLAEFLLTDVYIDLIHEEFFDLTGNASQTFQKYRLSIRNHTSNYVKKDFITSHPCTYFAASYRYSERIAAKSMNRCKCTIRYRRKVINNGAYKVYKGYEIDYVECPFIVKLFKSLPPLNTLTNRLSASGDIYCIIGDSVWIMESKKYGNMNTAKIVQTCAQLFLYANGYHTRSDMRRELFENKSIQLCIINTESNKYTQPHKRDKIHIVGKDAKNCNGVYELKYDTFLNFLERHRRIAKHLRNNYMYGETLRVHRISARLSDKSLIQPTRLTRLTSPFRHMSLINTINSSIHRPISNNMSYNMSYNISALS